MLIVLNLNISYAKRFKKYIWIAIITILTFGLNWFADDYKKIITNSSSGISSKSRIIIQILYFQITYLITINLDQNTDFYNLTFPFLKKLDYRFFNYFIFRSIFIIHYLN